MLVGRVGFEPTITGARDQYYLDPVLSTGSLRPSCPHIRVVWTTAPQRAPIQNEQDKLFNNQRNDALHTSAALDLPKESIRCIARSAASCFLFITKPILPTKVLMSCFRKMQRL